MYQDYETVIGLEVHVELKTKSKIFCSCSTAFGAEPNTQTCPACAGFPGTLPVLNRKVVELAIKTGLALNCEIAQFSRFDRKNYFYPDLPKAYQVSQYFMPICLGGYLDINMEEGSKKIGITRAHIEEDAGKLVHQGTIANTPFSLVDLNRSGIPLLEIVSEPDIRNAQEARAYLEKLRSILLFIGASDCKMEEGSLRCDANISVRKVGETKLGVRAEIKNLNSFKSLERALEYEARRQIEAVEDGELLVQETLTWDEEKMVTLSMRSKEEAQDYRYFPDPNLPPVQVDQDWINELRQHLPELPDQAQKRLVEKLGLSSYAAGIITLTPQSLQFFDQTLAQYSKAKTVANWMMGELNRLLNQTGWEIDQCKITPERLAALLRLVDDGTINGKIAKTVFESMFHSGKTPEDIIRQEGLAQISDEDAIGQIVAEVIAANPKVVEDYRQGKEKAAGFLVGQIMRASKGQANPAIVNQLLKKSLE